MIPAAVVPTFTDAQTRSVVESTFGKRGDQPALCLGPALLDQRTEAADQVHPDLSGHRVESAGDGQEALRPLAGGHPADRADRDPAIHDRDAVAPFDLAADGAQPAGIMHQTLADPVA